VSFELVTIWLNDHAAILGALSTTAIAALTVFLLFENRALRQAGIQPKVVAYLAPHSDGNGAVELVLSNVGRGPAFQLSFSFKCDPNDFKDHNVMVYNEPKRTAISVLPQNENIRFLFGMGFQLFGNVDRKTIDILKPFEIDMTYYNLLGRKCVDSINLDVAQYHGLKGMMNKSNHKRISDSLESISKQMANIARGNIATRSEQVETTGVADNFVNRTQSAPINDD